MGEVWSQSPPQRTSAVLAAQSEEGPFYALKVGPALLAVTGGLKTNVDFQCLDAEGKPIEGLYALGNCQGDITAVDYPINVAGNSHGRCITYGYLLGRDLAKA